MASLGTNYSQNDVHDNANAMTSANHQHAYSADSSTHSGVSWGAVLAGTAVAAALSLALIVLGVGFGMSSISVWSGQGISAGSLGFTAIIWLAVTQIIAYGMGGYLAGRLRVKWVSVHNDEVYFRDTAHGFLTWALATLLCATLLASIIGKITGGAVKAGANLAGEASTAMIGAAATKGGLSNSEGTSNSSFNNPLQYVISSLFRKDNVGANAASDTTNNASNESSPDTGGANHSAEVMGIFANNMNASELPPNDVKYAGQLVSQQTGLSQTEAESRVAMAFKTLQEKKVSAIQLAKETAEKARKTAANSALWFFVLLLIGAFSASLAATWGGRSRDS